MIVPVVIFLALNAGRPSAAGWGMTMSTDTAFALGLLALVARGLPDRVRIFLLTVVVVDDLVALLVIATVYSGAFPVLGNRALAAGVAPGSGATPSFTACPGPGRSTCCTEPTRSTSPSGSARFICFGSSADLPRIGIAALRAEAFIVTPAWLPRLSLHHRSIGLPETRRSWMAGTLKTGLWRYQDLASATPCRSMLRNLDPETRSRAQPP